MATAARGLPSCPAASTLGYLHCHHTCPLHSSNIMCKPRTQSLRVASSCGRAAWQPPLAAHLPALLQAPWGICTVITAAPCTQAPSCVSRAHRVCALLAHVIVQHGNRRSRLTFLPCCKHPGVSAPMGLDGLYSRVRGGLAVILSYPAVTTASLQIPSYMWLEPQFQLRPLWNHSASSGTLYSLTTLEPYATMVTGGEHTHTSNPV